MAHDLLAHGAEQNPCDRAASVRTEDDHVDIQIGGDPRFLHFYEMDTDDPETAFKAMTPLVMQRIGDEKTDAFKRWAWGPSLRIMYVNSFVRVGASDAK